MRGSSQSEREYSLWLQQLLISNLKKKNLKTWSQKTMSVLAFRTVLTLNENSIGLVVRWLFFQVATSTINIFN